ncbi:MAG TPA: hypothetical protein VF832_11545 [Longimicrobiales bacterium]
MRSIMTVVAVVAALVPATVGAQQISRIPPVCKASMDGGQLTTVVQFDDGYTVEGPWQVLQNRAASLDDGIKGIQVGARLDRIVEVDPSGSRQATPFPNPVDVTFEGHNQDELMSRAAQIWCASVMKARAEAPQKAGGARQQSTLVTRATD